MAEQARLDIGDFLPDFQLTNQRGGGTGLLATALGKSLVVLFFADDGTPDTERLLQGFVDVQPRLGPHIHLIAVNGAAPESNAANPVYTGLPFPILGDPDGAVHRACGISPAPGGAAAPGAYTLVTADANRRVVKIDRGAGGAPAAELVARFENEPRPAAREVGPSAPVLIVPRVFDQEYCRRLIALWETGGNAPSGVFRADYRESGGLLDPKMKARRDHIVTDPAINEEIGGLIGRRVVPEILKAFSFKVNYVKEFKIACYDATESGFFRPHRDNVKPIGTGRRFAMSLNLNTGDYEGGYLRFPEYGPHLYRPAAGDAVVFACPLLHEATPVTAGRRFVLLTFFYGPEGEEQGDA